MPRLSVWVSDELQAAVKAAKPGANYSAALQAGLRTLLECDHDRLACSSCGHELAQADIVRPALDRFFLDLMQELRALVDAFGTVEGAARMVRKVALHHGIGTAARHPLPRAGSHARRLKAEAEPPAVTELPLEAGARRRHPTAHTTTNAQEATA